MACAAALLAAVVAMVIAFVNAPVVLAADELRLEAGRSVMKRLKAFTRLATSALDALTVPLRAFSHSSTARSSEAELFVFVVDSQLNLPCGMRRDLCCRDLSSESPCTAAAITVAADAR